MFDAAIVTSDLAAEALAGLTATPKTLPSKFFYDEEGVRLFDAITRLPEYYVTRTEHALLATIAEQIAALAPKHAALVEYGTSDETKAQFLLGARGAVFDAYVPIDVAGGALEALHDRMAHSNKGLAVYPVCADFLRQPAMPAEIAGHPRFGFFPGSTIGNLEPDVAVRFLRDARAALGAGAWLIVGADLRKDPALLVPAYDDAQGVTAAFNLNILRHLNRVAGADFEPRRFAHRAVWNDSESRIEMHLECLAAHSARIAGTRVDFARGETIHTENSYKHALPAFQALAARAGWKPMRAWTDARDLFAVHALFNPG